MLLNLRGETDRHFRDGRLRNAYVAGPPTARLPGWWDAAAGRWVEDAYQVGTATGVVAWAMLRFTPHRILSAPYHRNQGGILTEMYIGLSNPQQAESFLRGAGVTVIAYCAGDWQTHHFAELEPQGLYADLARGNIPAYLEALPAAEGSDLTLYRVLPEEK